ncbi:recombinase A [Dictyostelium discoideum AX4]|uniref:Mitochondrial DNA repair protein recA homolog n=1 Tax=Dictyostelium discoideum TaxID=44689 RepID=RECAM_DICDI|nr:recombinase A [Dictyostelium discoideum AX4]Q75JL2.1 RecName: Full=Mitochondrial DNA repair protein recA homolog; AltName: Full=Recombinase A homolog [Dictyostelium discoideum]EAL69336.1 recombinase A [Dictyostelium discoideum AX4]FAA00018.1 TPA: RecA [Dictyostelium discoideum]|eukprot:XP_643316.1 recombinase A [Dictyostelium discoideum AX4]
MSINKILSSTYKITQRSNNNNILFNGLKINSFSLCNTKTNLFTNKTNINLYNNYSKSSKSGKKSKKDEDDEDGEIETSKTSKKSASSSSMENVLKELEKSFGKGTLMKLGSQFSTQKVEVIPSGSMGLDIALGVGGLPKGRVTEIFGPESSGKTTLALHVIAQAQKAGGNCTFIDAEHALNPQWAARLGVNLDELFVSQPDNGEQALEIVDSLLRSKTMSVIVVDSVAALVPRVEIEGEMGDSHLGVQARLMSQALRKLSPTLKDSNCVLIFINQIRMKIGVMFGNPEVTSGGNALKFFSSIRIDIRKVGTVKKGDDIIASQVKAKVVKNKLAPPFKEAIFDIDFQSGINKTGEIIDLAVAEGIIDKMGSWYSYNDIKLDQGREKTKYLLEKTQPNLLVEIENKLRDKLIKSKPLINQQQEEEGNDQTSDEFDIENDDEIIEEDIDDETIKK